MSAETGIIRAALASREGTRVDLHFGKADRFWIHELVDGNWRHLETRETGQLCGEIGHDENHLARVIQTISDCQIVICAQVGPPIVRILEAKGIRILNVEEETTKVLARLASPVALRTLFAAKPVQPQV